METYPDGFKVVKTAVTKQSEGSNVEVTHVLTYDFTGASFEDVAGKAADSMRIDHQGKVRRAMKKGTYKTDYPPGKITIKVADVLAGRGGVVSEAAATAYLESMGEDAARAWLIREGYLKE